MIASSANSQSRNDSEKPLSVRANSSTATGIIYYVKPTAKKVVEQGPAPQVAATAVITYVRPPTK
ncbi:MAG TPA: hypothetical protein VMX97_10350, partial [Hyphomicrobiaceae bacterium]|nr:hypothetical protein [Hyphomicrobiaceae bacterium]